MSVKEIEMKVKRTIKRIVCHHSAIPIKDIKIRWSLEALGLDGLGAIEILMELEDTFNIEISFSEFSDIKTVKELVTFIKGKLK